MEIQNSNPSPVLETLAGKSVLLPNYISDGPGYSGPLVIQIGNGVVQIAMPQTQDPQGNIEVMQLVLTEQRPTIAAVMPFDASHAQRIVDNLDENSKDFCRNADEVSSNRTVIVRWSDDSEGAILVWGEPCYVSVIHFDGKWKGETFYSQEEAADFLMVKPPAVLASVLPAGMEPEEVSQAICCKPVCLRHPVLGLVYLDDPRQVNTQIDGMPLISVNGRRYEWNATFSSYWTVNGDPNVLMARDLLGATVESGVLSTTCSADRQPTLVVDGLDASGAFAGDGEIPPFVVFDVDQQKNIAGPFDTRSQAEQHRLVVLAGGQACLNAQALQDALALRDSGVQQLQQAKPATKLVEVRLSALTRMEYTEVVEVPANITADELNDLVNTRYKAVDGGEFVSDPDYWERGTCYATDAANPHAQPSMMAFRTEHGMHIERADASAMAEQDCTENAKHC